MEEEGAGERSHLGVCNRAGAAKAPLASVLARNPPRKPTAERRRKCEGRESQGPEGSGGERTDQTGEGIDVYLEGSEMKVPGRGGRLR